MVFVSCRQFQVARWPRNAESSTVRTTAEKMATTITCAFVNPGLISPATASRVKVIRISYPIICNSFVALIHYVFYALLYTSSVINYSSSNCLDYILIYLLINYSPSSLADPLNLRTDFAEKGRLSVMRS